MFSIDEINDMLDEVAGDLPEEIFLELNGGVSLLERAKKSEEDSSGGLYTLGEYCHDRMGRYINIYYGSICAVYPGATASEMRGHLRDLLAHELTHHLESLAGERDLEIQDELDMEEYRRGRF